MKNKEESPKKKSDSDSLIASVKNFMDNVIWKDKDSYKFQDDTFEVIVKQRVTAETQEDDELSKELEAWVDGLFEKVDAWEAERLNVSNKEESPKKEPKKIWIKADHSHSIEDILRIMRELGYKVSAPVALTDGEFGIQFQGVYPFNTRESDELKSLDGQEDLMSVASAEQFLKEYGQIEVSLNDIPSTTVNDLPYFKESDLCKYLKGILTVVIKDLDA